MRSLIDPKMKYSPLLTVLATALVMLISCKNKTTGLLIPKDAAMVVHVNGSAITSKLSWNEIKQTNWFKELYKNSDDSFSRKLMNNPDSSGIDIKSSFAIFIKKQGNVVILIPKKDQWKCLMESVSKFSKDYMSTRTQPKQQDREDL